MVAVVPAPVPVPIDFGQVVLIILLSIGGAIALTLFGRWCMNAFWTRRKK